MTLYAQCLDLARGDAVSARRFHDFIIQREAREVGCGLSDKAVTIQGGDIDVDGEGFTPMRPDDADPETGRWP